MQIQFWAATDVGKTRDHNEDNFLVDRKLNLFIVADGMGGHAAGEIASSVAVHEVRKVLTDQREVVESYARSGSVLLRQTVLALIERAISQACNRVYQLAQEDSERRGMGTTLSMLLIAKNRGFVGHVGDSRIYRSRRGQVTQVTEDHSVVNELIKLGRLKPGEEFNGPYKNAVTRAVGVHPSVEVDTFDFDLQQGDNYLLCSDGLSCYLTDELTLDYSTREHLKSIPQLFIDHANESGGKDNITAIIVRTAKEGQKETSISSSSDAEDELTDMNSKTEPPPLPPENESHSVSEELDRLPLHLLRMCPLFSFLNEHTLYAIARLATIYSLPPHSHVFTEGTPSDEVYFVLDGLLEIEQHGEVIGEIQEGNLLVEEALFSRITLPYSAQTQTDAIILGWDRHALFGLMSHSSHVAARVMWGAAHTLHKRQRKLSQNLNVIRSFVHEHKDQEWTSDLKNHLLTLTDPLHSLPLLMGNEPLNESYPLFLEDFDQQVEPQFNLSLKEALEQGALLDESEEDSQIDHTNESSTVPPSDSNSVDEE
jgi:serine/threonine protein phosphatase PrpC/CRP-like cAMP-binding protein